MPETKKEWGPRIWGELHRHAIAYPDRPTPQQKIAAHLWVWGALQMLPCPECQAHATTYARANPPRFGSSAELQTWVWEFHNAVNRRLGKPEMSGDEYRRTYLAELQESFCRQYGTCI